MNLTIMRFIAVTILFFQILIVKAEPLTVGIVSYDPPFVVRASTDHYFGFDVEIMTRLCAEMQAQCAFKPMPFNQLFAQLNKGTIDLAIASITITEDRQQKYSFSLPYLVSNARFITNKKNASLTMNDLNKKTVGVIEGSIYKEWSNTKLPGVSIKEYPTSEHLIKALNDNEIDAVLMDDYSGDYWLTNSKNSFTSIGKPFLVGSGYAIMAKSNSPLLIQKVDDALKKITNDEFYISLYRKYFHTIPTHP
ncbi:transporter substrate-binding domain-containing protein [uncultured Legionella sp.]|uniref:transporter substrate-binding domain-containing protein n=1 Tax=uncultured Legionella sp. TaxID=210934 RepID=UPI002624FC52|nr:transporter substrate-binding domain-containing protein [uncultured Legionella sp.]